jgi:hypothetical protein
MSPFRGRLDGHPVDVQRVLSAERTGDEVRLWAIQRDLRFRDVARARGLIASALLLRLVAVQDGENPDQLVDRVVCVLAGIVILDQVNHVGGGSGISDLCAANASGWVY